MDHFGIGSAVRGSIVTYLSASRQTGRTTSLVESVKDGDRICFSTNTEANRVRQLCAERGVTVTCIVVDPKKTDYLLSLGTSQGRTLFDHSWVEEYYIAAIDRARRDIDHFEQRLSGYGEAHRATRRCAEELSKWQFALPPNNYD